MGRRILFLFVGQAFVYQVFTATLHPALQQYILSGLTQQAPSTYPSVTITKPTTPHNIQSIAALASLLSPPAVQQHPIKPQAVPSLPSSLITALAESNSASSSNYNSLAALAAILSPTAKPPAVSSSPSSLLAALSESPTAGSTIDASLLNNLAIALQLLLVSNIINAPPQESNPEPVVVPGYPIHEYKESAAPISMSYAHPQANQPATTTMSPPANHYMPNYEQPIPNPGYNHYETSHYTPPIPNANFLGSSNPFGGTVPPGSASSSRGGFSLMSPYEALNPSSPYSDPILSSAFGSVMTSKKDFQSPYSSIMAADNKDLFSMSDFF